MELIKWVDRKFDFSFPAGVFPAILERLSGTPVRLEKILEGIEKNAFVNKAAGVDEIIITRTAIHSRLNKEMRFVDMLYFTAEHDDHHLAVIRNLLNRN